MICFKEQLGEMLPDSFPLALETPVTVDVPDIAAVTPNVTLAPDDIMGDKTDFKFFMTYIFVTEYGPLFLILNVLLFLILLLTKQMLQSTSVKNGR